MYTTQMPCDPICKLNDAAACKVTLFLNSCLMDCSVGIQIFNLCSVCSQSVLDTGKKLSDDNTIGQEEIQQRLAQFVDHWKELKDLSGAR